jgi:hypothetical protein
LRLSSDDALRSVTAAQIEPLKVSQPSGEPRS